MGIDYSYDCIEAQQTKEILAVQNGKFVLCNLQFEDEHEHKFAPIQDVLVYIGNDKTAEMVRYVENHLEDDEFEEHHDTLAPLAKKCPRYDTNNEKEFYNLVTG